MGSQNKTKRNEMLRMFKRQKGKCHICDLPMNLSQDLHNMDRATADHLIPKSFGGPVKGNIKAAHAKCNYARGNGKLYQKEDKYERLCSSRCRDYNGEVEWRE